jgi:hypothetical protein
LRAKVSMNQEVLIKIHTHKFTQKFTQKVRWMLYFLWLKGNHTFHKAMFAEFLVDKQDQVLLTLQHILLINWDVKTIKKHRWSQTLRWHIFQTS